MKFLNNYNKLLVENYQGLFTMYDTLITIHLYQYSYQVSIEICNAKFTGPGSYHTDRLFKVMERANIFRNSIHFNQCIFENFIYTNPWLSKKLFYFESPSRLNKSLVMKHHQLQITFTNCIFQYNELNRIFNLNGAINIKLQSCIFKYSQFQLIRRFNSFNHQNSIIIANTSFYEITTDIYLIHVSQLMLNLEGPVIFSKVKAKGILQNQCGMIICHNYIEFSENMITFPDHTDYIILKQNTTINMTDNEYSGITEEYTYRYKASDFIAPCYYQYDNEGEMIKLNFSVMLHNDTSIYYLMTEHCRWLPDSAFNNTKPIDINNRIIKSDFPLTYKHEKLVCFCTHTKTQQNCDTDTLATAYPGQTISLSPKLNHLYFKQTEIVTIEMNDDVLPPTACKVAKVNELIHQVYHASCTVINFTIIHNAFNNLQWCELLINILSTHQIDAYYIDMLCCPAGFVQQNGICICDPILNSAQLYITICDINHQTILRPAGSWLSAVTINDSHQYHISPHCPLHYCLTQSSQLNFSTPNSQCQSNRDGLLCGQCQQGLSTVFGYSHCQHCSNIYLLLIIPIAVAGLVLVLLLFILNLTVTDGDINGFILYVNIISINSHVFFPQYSNSISIFYVFISLVNLDIGIPTCFYNGMDDYAKMWLQLAFPAYLILIATLLIIASRHSTTVRRITARRALPVLATLFLLSYTKVLRTVSCVLFYYSTITHLPSGHTTLVWAVDANVPLFGLKYTALFIVCLFIYCIITI